MPSAIRVIDDHGELVGLSDDDHSQYALLEGRAGGQALKGGTAASDNLTLESTADATKGFVLLNPFGGNVGVGTTIPGAKLSIIETDGNVLEIGDVATKRTITYDTNVLNFNSMHLNIGYDIWVRGTYPTGFGVAAIGTRLRLLAGGTEQVSILETGRVGIKTTVPGTNLHINDETTTATDVLFQVESDVATADTIKARIEADGEFFSDVGFTVFSPSIPDDPLQALEEAVKEASKPKKPYLGLYPAESLDELLAARRKLEEAISKLVEKEKENPVAFSSEKAAELISKERDLAEINNRISFIETASTFGVSSREDERLLYGKDIAKIAIGLARYCSQLEERVQALERKLAAMEI